MLEVPRWIEERSRDARTLVLKGYIGSVWSVAVSHDGERIFSGAEDGTLKVWNGKTGLEDAMFVLGSAVRSVAICLKDRKVAIGQGNGTFEALDCSTGDAV